MNYSSMQNGRYWNLLPENPGGLKYSQTWNTGGIHIDVSLNCMHHEMVATSSEKGQEGISRAV